MKPKILPFAGDAFAAFRKFCGRPGAFFLDSSRPGPQARHSYIGFSPFKTIESGDWQVLRKALKKYRRPVAGGTFSGGAAGYIGYEGRFHFGLYDQVLVFDHMAKTVAVHAPAAETKNICAILKMPAAKALIAAGTAGKTAWKSDFTKTSYMAAVRRALDHIRRGDIYQINLSRCETMEADWQDSADACAIYAALRRYSPSPFSAYYDAGGQTILSSSPERFIKLSGRRALVKPMKGTRPRGASPAQDERLRQDLLHSPKEIAELLMVTDLERNDLGRVCTYGSVKVSAMRTIEKYKTVFQATATIEGLLAPGRDQVDLLQATFPSGSVTGCPKIEAMKIIQKLEKSPRGLYTGALGYIDFGGDMDFSVLIRAMFLKPGRVTFHVGGGIVADSDPAAEYDETCIKAQAMQKALQEVFHA